jgi:hypothetical protein
MEDFKRLLSVGARQYSIAASLQHYFADGKRLLVVINAENRLLGSHVFSPNFARTWAAGGELILNCFDWLVKQICVLREPVFAS